MKGKIKRVDKDSETGKHTREQGCQGDSRRDPIVFVVGKVTIGEVPSIILKHVTVKT